MDQISLNGIRVNANIGTNLEDRVLEQEVYIDLCLYYDFSKIQESDDLKDGIDYKKVIEILRNLSSDIQKSTLESYANDIAINLKKSFKLNRVDLGLETNRYNEDLDIDEIKVKITR